jgi:hypothetical protein
MRKKIEQHYKSNSNWQWLGDLALVMIPAIHTGLMAAPVSPTTKFWIGFLCDNALIAFKFFAKYKNLK